MARIQGVPPGKAGLLTKRAYEMARQRVGKVPEPMTIAAHNAWVFRAYGAYEWALDHARQLDAKLKALASLRTATLVGCPF